MSETDLTDPVAETPSAEVEVIGRNEIETVKAETLERFFASAMADSDMDPATIQNDIMAQVLSSNTADEVLTNLEATGLREHLERPFLLRGFRFNKGDFEEGNPFYALLDVVWEDTGEADIVSCGAKKIVAQVFRLAQLGSLPITLVCLQSKKPTKAGFWPLRLERPSA